jgi:hypothetical protein
LRGIILSWYSIYCYNIIVVHNIVPYIIESFLLRPFLMVGTYTSTDDLWMFFVFLRDFFILMVNLIHRLSVDVACLFSPSLWCGHQDIITSAHHQYILPCHRRNAPIVCCQIVSSYLTRCRQIVPSHNVQQEESPLRT